MNLDKLAYLEFCPTEGLNKKTYTPDSLEFYVTYYDKVSVKKKYNIGSLLTELIKKDNLDHLKMLLLDYPNAINLLTSELEPLIHTALKYQAMNIFQFLKDSNKDLYSIGHTYNSIYFEALKYPKFWSILYNDLSVEQLYEQLTKLNFVKKAGFEILLEMDEKHQNLLIAFKEKYPVVLEKIIIEKINENWLTKLSGQTLRVVSGYHDIEKELNLILNNETVNSVPKKNIKF